MKGLLLGPVLFLQPLQILALDQEALRGPQSLQLLAEQLFEARYLGDVGDDWLGGRDLIRGDNPVDEAVGKRLLGCEAMLQEDHFRRLATPEDLWELDGTHAFRAKVEGHEGDHKERVFRAVNEIREGNHCGDDTHAATLDEIDHGFVKSGVVPQHR